LFSRSKEMINSSGWTTARGFNDQGMASHRFANQ